MNFIRLYRQGECEVPDGDDYVMVTATEIDTAGNWVMSSVRSFQTWEQLRDALRTLVVSGDDVVIRGSSYFDRLAAELG